MYESRCSTHSNGLTHRAFRRCIHRPISLYCDTACYRRSRLVHRRVAQPIRSRDVMWQFRRAGVGFTTTSSMLLFVKQITIILQHQTTMLLTAHEQATGDVAVPAHAHFLRSPPAPTQTHQDPGRAPLLPRCPLPRAHTHSTHPDKAV